MCVCVALLELTEEVSEEDHQPFPTLQYCLEHVDPAVGFNIEIKYPQLVEVSAGSHHVLICTVKIHFPHMEL